MNWKQNRVPRPVRVERPYLRVPAARGYRVARLAPAFAPAAAIPAVPVASGRDFRRGMILLASLGVLLGCVLAGGYGVHAQIAAANERAARQYWQLAAATREELRDGTVLFVPIGGNVCRRRFIDNATWTMRDGDDIECDAAVRWNSNQPEQQYYVGLRMDAVSRTFRAKND